MKQKIDRKRAWRYLLPWALTLLWMGLIFAFSAQDAESSSQFSGQTAFGAAFWFWPGFSSLSAEEQAIWVENAQFLVRKTAHFLVYAGLGVLLCWDFSRLNQPCSRKIGLAWAIGTAYAASDEIHQLFVPGRSGQLRDVLLDSTGVLIGLLSALALSFLYKKAAAKAAAKRIQK
ncbi:MAG: VanZ family protein [Oscillospiraceae bacterium]|nr:VanZ family protein [Oscillospiraceae bacterium]